MRSRAWLILALSMLVCAPSAVADVTPDYYPFPAGYTDSGASVTADGAGNIWFTAKGPSHVSSVNSAQPTPTLARLVPGQAAPGTSTGFSFFPLPDPTPVNCCANQATAITFNKVDGKLYYVRNDGGLGATLPSALVPGSSNGFDTVTLPVYQPMYDVTPAPAGGVWFTESGGTNTPPYYGDRVAFYNGSVSEGPNVAIQDGNTALNGVRYSSRPAGVTVDATGKVWFVENDPGNPGYRVASYSGAGSHYDEFQITPCEASSPCSGSYGGNGLTDVTVAPDGGIWFTNVLNRKFGRLDPSGHTMVQYTMASIGLPAGQPFRITTAPDGTLWMTSYQGITNATNNAIVRIDPSATPTFQVIHTSPSAPPLGIAADNVGNIWFGLAPSGPTGLVGRLAGVVGVTPPSPADPGDGPPPALAVPAAPVNAPATPPAVLKPAAIGQARIDPPQTGNGAINTNQVCAGPPAARCSVIYLIKEHEYVTGFPSSVSKKRKKHQPRVLGTKTVTLNGGQSAKVTVKLNKLGKRILKGKHKVKVVFSATQKLANGKTKTVTRKTLTIRSK
jgi:streptogramin lyase